jgi:hypothetical protein
MKLSSCLTYPHANLKTNPGRHTSRVLECYEKKNKDAPKISAPPVAKKHTRKPHPLHDWMTIYKYVDQDSFQEGAVAKHEADNVGPLSVA